MKTKTNRLIDAFINTYASGKFMAAWGIAGVLMLIGVQFAAIGISGDQDPKEVTWAMPVMCAWLTAIPVAVTLKYLK